MAKTSSHTPPRKYHSPGPWYSEDFVLGVTVLIGIAAVAMICIFTPARKFIVAPFRPEPESVKSADSGDASAAENSAGEGNWTGIYSMGKVTMSLGREAEYLDSEMNLEYNGRLLGIKSKGAVQDERSANRYLRAAEDKLKDALIMGSSGFTGSDVSGGKGLDQFKNEMVLALNRQFGDEDIVTNIYFNRFVLYSENLDSE